MSPASRACSIQQSSSAPRRSLMRLSELAHRLGEGGHFRARGHLFVEVGAPVVGQRGWASQQPAVTRRGEDMIRVAVEAILVDVLVVQVQSSGIAEAVISSNNCRNRHRQLSPPRRHQRHAHNNYPLNCSRYCGDRWKPQLAAQCLPPLFDHRVVPVTPQGCVARSTITASSAITMIASTARWVRR